MSESLFTPEELEELRRADAELDAEFRLTLEDFEFSRKLDQAVVFERKDNRSKKIAAKNAAYYAAHKEEIAAQQAAYREANKEKIADYQAAYYEVHKEEIAARRAAYREANKEEKRMTERRNTARGANEWADTYGGLGLTTSMQLTQLPLDILDAWVDESGIAQPFKPYPPEKLNELAENIKVNGVIEPICARPKTDGRFQIVAGHNRVAAAKLAGLPTIPALVKQMDDAEAAIRMVDSNLQHREKLLYSEKAFAYKTRLDAMKRQGQRSDLTSVPVGQKFEGRTSRELLAEKSPDSNTQIQRYIRLTFLHPTLLELVDNEKFAFRAAVEVSYLDLTAQGILLTVMEEAKCKAPSMAQASQLRKLAESGTLDEDGIFAVMVKPPKTAVKLPMERISRFFPENATPQEMEEEICQALKAWRDRSDP